MPIRVIIRGPIFDRATVERTVAHEMESAIAESAGHVLEAANRAVHTDQGIFARSWQPIRFVRGHEGALITGTLENTAPHAAVLEGSRRAGAKPPPVAVIAAWLGRRGGDPKAAWPVARAIGRRGIPASRPVERGIEAASGAIAAAFRFAGRRIAEALG